MKTIAVITEFNPFHNGHGYFLSEARKRSGADFCIAVMSGDFVQRGEPAVFDKYIRAEAALLGGADLVLELPVRYASANAGDFALGAVRILHALGAVDELWFGSECGETGPFRQLSEVLASESGLFRERLAEELKTGLPYPGARALALADCLAQTGRSFPGGRDGLLSFLKMPNNILGLEYCTALRRIGSRIRPETLRREGSGYHAGELSDLLPSASAVRKALTSGGLSSLQGQVPEAVYSVYEKYLSENTPVYADDFSLLLKYRLMSCSAGELCSFLDVSEDLSLRIRNHLNEFRSFTQFAELLKTRNLTRTHVNRSLLHILLGIRKDSAVPGAFSGTLPDMLSGALPEGALSGMLPGALPAGTSPDMLSDVLPAGASPGMLSGALPEGALSGMLPGALPEGALSGMLPGALPEGALSGMLPGALPAGASPRYAHILGMGSCRKLLSAIKEKGRLTLCASPSVIRDGSCDEDLFASNLYETVKSLKSGTPFVHEFSRKLKRLPH